jgi:hypothetical protein
MKELERKYKRYSTAFRMACYDNKSLCRVVFLSYDATEFRVIEQIPQSRLIALMNQVIGIRAICDGVHQGSEGNQWEVKVMQPLFILLGPTKGNCQETFPANSHAPHNNAVKTVVCHEIGRSRASIKAGARN